MQIEPQRVRVQPPADEAGNRQLIELIRTEIERGGPVTFARFMELALYTPALGYYATTDVRATRAGDFLTAPELHPIFGRTVGRQIHEMWTRLGEPSGFTLREYGAGTGALGNQIREGLQRAGSALALTLRYEPVEVPGRREAAPSTEEFIGVALGNEFLDALPVHRVINDSGRLREIYVDWREESLVEVMGPLSDVALASRITPDELLPAQRAEVSLAIPAWLDKVGGELERGYVLLFDYGLRRATLRSADRPNGTIRSFKGNHVSSDVLTGVGERDITAHVDLDALADDARRSGFDVLGEVSQAHFLVGCGLEELYATEKDTADNDLDHALQLRSAMRRLLDPRQLGGYTVLALGKGVNPDPPLRGFA